MMTMGDLLVFVGLLILALAAVVVLVVMLWTVAKYVVVNKVMGRPLDYGFGPLQTFDHQHAQPKRTEPVLQRAPLTATEMCHRCSALAASQARKIHGMSYIPTDKASDEQLRHALMRIGGTLTIAMANACITPEEVAAHTAGQMTADDISRLMTGSDPNISVGKLSFLSGLLGSRLTLGLTALPAQPPAPPPPPAQPLPPRTA